MRRSIPATRRSIPLVRYGLAALVCLGGSGLLGLQERAAADEPAKLFLQRLRAVGYYDTAIQYLERLDQYPGVPSELREAVELERAQTLLEAAGSSRSVSRRDEYYVEAETALQTFLQNQSEHPRAAEARLQLGTLQMVRGAVLQEASQGDKAMRQQARESYLAAAKTFDTIVENLRVELEAMQGQRINEAEQPELAALRTRYRGQYMRAKLRGGEARRRAAETFEDPATEGEQLLTAALERFTELSEKYDEFLPGAQAMLQRGQVQAQLGQDKAAIDSFQRVLEQSETDVLRLPKMEAVTGLARLWLAEDPPRAQAAIERGQPLVDSARPDERRSAELQELRVVLAQAYLAKAQRNAAEQGNVNERKEAETNARQLLVASNRVPGDHQDAAKRLLAGLGIDAAAETANVERPKSLEEAVTAARGIVEQVDQMNLTMQLLRDQLQNAGTDKASIQQELTTIEKEQQAILQRGIEILQEGMRYVRLGADPTQVQEARQFLAYTLFRAGQYSEAAVVGGFMARTAPGNPLGLAGGLLALSSLQTQLQETPQASHLLQRIESLGSYLVAQWPDDPQVAQTRGLLVQIALSENRWDDARVQIEQTPDDSPKKAEFQRLLGQLLWNRYLTLQQEAAEAAETDAILPRAADDLTAGLKALQPADLKPADLQAAMILAKIQLRQNEPQRALNTLQDKQYGPLTHLDQVGSPNADFQAALYGVALQAVVAQMTHSGTDSQALLKRAGTLMDKLRDSIGDEAGANDRLVRMYKSLAGNIRRQLEDAPPGKQGDLIQAFELFLSQVADQSDDPETLQMVGQTLAEMGQAAMEENQTVAQGQAAALLQSAAETLSSLLEAGQEENQRLVIRFQRGRVYRLLGEYKQAIDEFEKVLQAKPMMLEAQVEAARAYEQWAAVIPAKYAGKAYESALRGARPAPQTGKKTIWGWGKISQLTTGKREFRETFFEARYHVALCRFLQGKANDQKATMRRAIKDITQLAATYPEMGGPPSKDKFDRLLRTIQRELQLPVTGLTED